MWEEIWGKLLLQWNVLLFIKTKSFIKIMCKTVLRFEVFQLLMFCNFVPSILWPETVFVWISTQTSDTLESNEWCLTCGRWKKKKDLCFWYFVGFTFFFKQVQVCCTGNHTQVMSQCTDTPWSTLWHHCSTAKNNTFSCYYTGINSLSWKQMIL